MNGIQQSEDFNGFKSQHFALILNRQQVTWQVITTSARSSVDLAPELKPGIRACRHSPVCQRT